MTCLNPRRSVRDIDGVTYFGEHSHDGWHETIEVPCNRCHFCMARRKRDWAIRATHEAEDHQRTIRLEEGPTASISNSCFVTLTYDEEHLPNDESVSISEFSRFMQRLRNRRRGESIRYLACGEYGSLGRPHYHGLLFGLSFHKDRDPLNRGTDAAYASDELTETWGKGRCELGPVNYATASYVAGYVVKKSYDEALVRRPFDEPDHTYVRNTSGTWNKVSPEFNTCSRRPGLARPWIERNLDSVYRSDSVHIDGRSFRPPKFYDKVLEEFRPDHWELIQAQRREHASGLGLTTGLERAARRSIFESSPVQRKQIIN